MDSKNVLKRMNYKMTNAALFDENFRSFAEMLGGAPRGARLSLAEPSLAAASGTSSAGENYALFGAPAQQKDVEAALRFFDERQAAFVVPWLRETPFSLAQAFEKYGLSRRRIYTSMYLPAERLAAEQAPEVIKITPERAEEWAEAAWLAFGGAADDPELENYRSFGAYLATCSGNTAYALVKDGRFAATALFHETPDTLGLYYFATLPEFRRQGLATILLESAASAFAKKGKPLVLLATEAGVPFYISFGFKIIEQVPIYSLTEDI